MTDPDPAGQEGERSRVVVTYRLAMGDYLRAVAQHDRRTLSSRAGAVALVLLAMVVWVLAPAVWVYPLSMLLLAGLMASGWLVVPIAWLRLRKARRVFEVPITMTFDEDGMAIRSAVSDGRVAWNAFDRVRFGAEFVWFRFVGGATQFVPTSAFGPGQLDLVRNFLARAGLIRP